VTTQLSILFVSESVIQKRVKFIAFYADNSDLFKYVSTNFMQFLGSFYNPNPEYTMENTKWAERVVTLSIRRRKSMAFWICIHFCCAIIWVSYTKNPGYTLENPKWAERVVTRTIRRRKSRASQNMYSPLLCNHRCLIYTKSWVYTRKSKMSWESWNTYYSTQENKSFTNMYPFLLCDHWGLVYRIKDHWSVSMNTIVKNNYNAWMLETFVILCLGIHGCTAVSLQFLHAACDTSWRLYAYISSSICNRDTPQDSHSRAAMFGPALWFLSWLNGCFFT